MDSILTLDLTRYLAKEPPYMPDLFDESYQDVSSVAWGRQGKGRGFLKTWSMWRYL